MIYKIIGFIICACIGFAIGLFISRSIKKQIKSYWGIPVFLFLLIPVLGMGQGMPPQEFILYKVWSADTNALITITISEYKSLLSRLADLEKRIDSLELYLWSPKIIPNLNDANTGCHNPNPQDENSPGAYPSFTITAELDTIWIGSPGFIETDSSAFDELAYRHWLGVFRQYSDITGFRIVKDLVLIAEYRDLTRPTCTDLNDYAILVCRYLAETDWRVRINWDEYCLYNGE